MERSAIYNSGRAEARFQHGIALHCWELKLNDNIYTSKVSRGARCNFQEQFQFSSQNYKLLRMNLPAATLVTTETFIAVSPKKIMI